MNDTRYKKLVKLTNSRVVDNTIEENFLSVEKLLHHQAHKFQRYYGGDLDELLSEANLIFMRANAHFQERQAQGTQPVAYATEIRTWVWHRLFDEMRIRLRREKRAKFHSLDASNAGEHKSGLSFVANAIPAPVKPSFDRESFARVLSDDARFCAELALNPPKVLEKKGRAKGGCGRNYKGVIRAHLVWRGWDSTRINEAFAEIAEALGQ